MYITINCLYCKSLISGDHNSWIKCKSCQDQFPDLEISFLVTWDHLIYTACINHSNQNLLLERFHNNNYSLYHTLDTADEFYHSKGLSNITPSSFVKEFNRYKSLLIFK